MTPEYIAKATPNPPQNRAPWYANTAPTYAGIFLWIAFYRMMGAGTLAKADLGTCIVGLVAAGLLCHFLYYLVPGLLGMKTGLPLYVVGSSTFGAQGGYLMPGLLMGLLQIGWFGVATSISTDFILKAAGSSDGPGTMPFIVTGVLWGVVFAFVGAKGIQYVARVATYLNFIPLLMLIVVFFQTPGSPLDYQPAAGQADEFAAFTTMLAVVIGFFATAGAAGADFGTNSRHASDVQWGGLIGVTLTTVIVGVLALATLAAANAVNPNTGFDYATAIQAIGGPIASSMFLLFALASIPATCFCIFIAGNSISTMFPQVSRIAASFAAAGVGIILAVTGIANNLASFFGLVGASFGPICGAMAADYLLSGRKWAGPRQGINMAGYAAWLLGFIVGILPNFLSGDAKRLAEPAALYSFIVGFVVYAIAAKAGMEPEPLEKSAAKSA